MSDKSNQTVEEIDDVQFLESFFGEGTTSILEKEEEKKDDVIDPIANINKQEEFVLDLSEDEEEEEDEQKVNAQAAEEENKTSQQSKTEDKNTEEELEEDSSDDEPTEIDAFSVINEMITEGSLLGFEDAEIETADDLKELIKANMDHMKNDSVIEEVKQEFFDGLPEELKIIADYSEKGATPDQIRSMFKAFSEVQQAEELNESTERGQKEIIKQYLMATDFGTADEIVEQIEEWEDMDRLEDKASKFKPKLENMRKQVIQQQMAQREQLKQQELAVRQRFVSGIDNALAKTQLINVTLPKSERVKLRKDLTENNYQSQINGRPLNGLGKVLEDITFVDPNPQFLAEITYFATDPEGFIKNLTEQIKQKEIGKTVKKLKTETVTVSNTKGKGRRNKKFVYRPINELD
jgi:hypothetical protein